MKKLAVVVCAVLGFAACGGDSSNSFTLSSGTYAISQISFSKDECNLTASHFLANDKSYNNPMEATDSNITLFTEWANKPTGAIASDAFTATVNAQYDNTPDGIDCKEQILKTVNGVLTANDTFTATYTYQSSKVSGARCAALNYPLPCTSVATFTATKK